MVPTELVHSFPSMYKAAKFMGTVRASISSHNGTRYKYNADGNIHLIIVLDPKNEKIIY